MVVVLEFISSISPQLFFAVLKRNHDSFMIKHPRSHQTNFKCEAKILAPCNRHDFAKRDMEKGSVPGRVKNNIGPQHASPWLTLIPLFITCVGIVLFFPALSRLRLRDRRALQ